MTEVTARRRLGSIHLRQLTAEDTHGLRVDLTDTLLRHAEDLADLGEREAFEVVQGHDDLLAFG